MARVKDLWFSEVNDPANPEQKIRKKTPRHPDNGGSRDAKRWLAVWIAPDGKEKTKAFLVKERAKAYARKMEEDAERGEYIDPKDGKTLFGPLVKKWMRLRSIGASSARKYETAFRLHVEPVFGERQVESIKPSEVLEWQRALAKTHDHSTQELAFVLVSGAFDLAVADKLRRDNPAQSKIVARPTAEVKERDAWTTEQVWAVIDAHPEAYQAIPKLSAGCGLRQGEAFGLAEDDFDFEAGRLTVRRQVARVGKEYVFKLPKGGKERTVPLSPGLARVAKAYIKAYPPRPYALPWLREDGKQDVDEHVCKLLFRWHGNDRRTHDKRIRAESYGAGIWKPALVKASVISEREKGARYAAAPADGTHALRHYYATTLLDAGVNLAGVMQFLGHSKKGKPVTIGVYAHVTEETFEAARNAVDRSLFRLRPVQDQRASGTVTELAVSE